MNEYSLDTDLMKFRTIWLRAIAHAWTDTTFHDLLIGKDPAGAIATTFGEKYTLPWSSSVELRVISAELNPDAGTQNPGFSWIGDDWVWPDDNNETLLLRLPLAAGEALDDNDRVAALADYYRMRPSIFGGEEVAAHAKTVRVPHEELYDGQMSEFHALAYAGTAANTSFLSSGVALSGPLVSLLDDTPGIGFGRASNTREFISGRLTFMDFEIVLLSLIGRAWANSAFRTMIVGNSTKALTTAMQFVHGYKVPWNLKIIIEDDSGSRWTRDAHPPQTAPASDESSAPDATKIGSRGHWDFSKAKKHVLTLVLPNAPPKEEMPVALAAYNATGAQYPFTCCTTPKS